MYGLSFSNSHEWIKVNANLVITDTQERREKLIVASLVDVDSAARGLAAHVLKGDVIEFFSDYAKMWSQDKFSTDKNLYRFVSRPLNGKLNHTVLLHKAVVDENLPDNTNRYVLSLNGDGNIADIFLRRFANDFNLPYVKAWAEPLWQKAKHEHLVRNLLVRSDGKFPQWKNAVALQFIPSFNEDQAKDMVSTLLKQRTISLPEGVTQAPVVHDTIKPDPETGTYKVTEYLTTYATHLATAIEDLAEPLHDLDRAIDSTIAAMGRTPFPAQAHTVQAILNGFGHGNKGIFAASDMGCGKSIIALATANAMSATRARKTGKKKGFAALLLVPGITVPKWVRDEIGATLPQAHVTVLESWRDVLAYQKRVQQTGKEPLEFVLLSRDTAKLGMPRIPTLRYKPEHVLYYDDRVRRLEDAFVCPDCGAVQTKTTQEAQKALAQKDFASLVEYKLGSDDLQKYDPKQKKQVWRDSIQDYHCSSCGHNLMRLAVPEQGEYAAGLKHSRLEPASLIAKRLPGFFDLLIVDELHQYKNSSGQGEAMGQLVSACKKVLGLTGTLSDGKASSLYHILRRTAPREMAQDGMDQKALGRFVNLYGSVEIKERSGEDDIESGGMSTRRKIVKNPPKEIPGLSPRLFVNHLANKTAFLELGDMGLPLVELEERPVMIDMDEKHQAAYTQFHYQFENEAKAAYAAGNNAAFAQFIPSVVNVANQPHADREAWIGELPISFKAIHSPDQLSAKERQLLDDVKAEIEQNRRCVVYVRYSGGAAQDNRLLDVLKKRGIRAKMMKASTDPEERVEWLEQAVKEHVQVVVLNAKLVEVGLDLLDFPTLIFYQFTDEIATMRQASRRAWRIGQHRACKVLYYVYKQSYEVVQFKRMLSKRSHAMLLEGRLDRSEVASFTEQDSKSASTYNIAACLGNMEDLSAKWKKLADKDIPAGVMTLREDEFKIQIKLAMIRLANETRVLAGLPTLPENPVVVDTPVQPIPFVETLWEPQNEGDLFSFVEQQEEPVPTIHGVPSTPIPTSSEPSVAIAIKTATELRAQMGLVTKAKRVKKAACDDQLGFDF